MYVRFVVGKPTTQSSSSFTATAPSSSKVPRNTAVEAEVRAPDVLAGADLERPRRERRTAAGNQLARVPGTAGVRRLSGIRSCSTSPTSPLPWRGISAEEPRRLIDISRENFGTPRHWSGLDKQPE